MSVHELVKALRQGGEETHEAALTLGLLIEREKVRRPAGDDGGIRVILGDEFTRWRLSAAEIELAVDELIRYVNETPDPNPTAVWALTKSFDVRIIPHLLQLLDRTLTDSNKEWLAYQALIGAINIGMSSHHKAAALAVIRRAAADGHGQVKETATSYLQTR